MISIKSEREIELMKKAGNIVYKTHQYLRPYLKPGITTKKLDELAENYIISLGATPSFKGFNGFPASICTSVNDEVVHGIPNNYKLKEGDIISIDIGACYQGYHGDSAWTYGIGKINENKEYLLKHTEQALYEGLKQVKAGNRIGDIGSAIEQYAKNHKLGVIRELVGHGVGNDIHEEPNIPNYGIPNTGIVIKSGMTIAIEPMLNLGTRHVVILDDDWTIVTRDGKPSAHFEHTVLVTDNGYLVLTGE
jgi:methionyl aminopeptidase